LCVLEITFIIFTVSPYHGNLENSFYHPPKIYFYDTGLAAYLLDVESADKLKDSDTIRGKLFENLVMSEIKKKLLAKSKFHKDLHFFKNQKSDEYEIDLIIPDRPNLKAIEIKISDKPNHHWFDRLDKFKKVVNIDKYIVYTGPTMETERGKFLNFSQLDELL
jgi:predicted AAA+ superfamily ATPase